MAINPVRINNYTSLNLDKVKAFNKQHPNYKATHYLCHIPKQPADTNTPFYGSWASVRRSVGASTTHTDAYWSVFNDKQNGYELASQKFALPNTDDGEFTDEMVAK